MKFSFFYFLSLVQKQDGESGWSSLHRALHFGHFAVASVLLQSGASVTIEDTKLRTPIDLLSGSVLQILGDQNTSGFCNSGLFFFIFFYFGYCYCRF